MTRMLRAMSVAALFLGAACSETVSPTAVETGEPVATQLSDGGAIELGDGAVVRVARGRRCATDEDCARNLVCIHRGRQAANGVCVAPCTSDADCASGQSCTNGRCAATDDCTDGNDCGASD